jgi:phospholipid-binding lipoprotein MlaA
MSFGIFCKRGLLAAVIVIMPLVSSLYAADGDLEALFDDEFTEKEAIVVYDPLEPVNRVFFVFNDRLYFWVLKPVGKVYTAVFADEALRGCVSAAFHNVLAPVRVVNNLLQGKFKQSGTELARFAINTVLGAGGLGDPAAESFGLDKADEDLGQTLGFYGVGEGIYLCWPLLGPSTARDTVGMAGDYFLNPLQYIFAAEPGTNAGLTALKIENAATLHGKDYEGLVADAFDPYISLRDIYYQHRRSLVASVGSAGSQDMGMEHEKGSVAFQEQCPSQYGNATFRNLAGARKYKQCLEKTGAQVSVNRTQKHGRAMYLVVLDEQSVLGQQVAMVAERYGQK